MSREVHVPFYERLGVQFPRPTHRFGVSFRNVEDLLAQRGITVSYEAIRLWCITFGSAYARRLKRRQGRLGNTWHLDEVFVTIQGQRHCLWRAVDQDGDVIDILGRTTRRGRRLVDGDGRASLPHACGVRSWRWTAAHGIPTLSLALFSRLGTPLVTDSACPVATGAVIAGRPLPPPGRVPVPGEARPHAVVRRTRRRAGAGRGAAVPVVWGRRRAGPACACCAR